MSTIMDRALPDVRDGLKPSQRRILVAMNDLNLGPASKHRQVRQDRRRHLAATITRTAKRSSTRRWSAWPRTGTMRYPLIDAQGNFGSIDGDPPGRHAIHRGPHDRRRPWRCWTTSTSTRSISSPTTTRRARSRRSCPASSPTCWSTAPPASPWAWPCNLLPHNLREICDAIVHVIDNPSARSTSC